MEVGKEPKELYQKARVVVKDGETLNTNRIQFSDDGR